MVPAENGMRSFSAGAVFVCSVQSTSGVALLRGRARPDHRPDHLDLWGRFVAWPCTWACSRPLGSLCCVVRAIDLWGRFVEARVTNASENGMIKSTILKDIGRLSFLEPRARVTATLLEPEARVKQQRRNE